VISRLAIALLVMLAAVAAWWLWGPTPTPTAVPTPPLSPTTAAPEAVGTPTPLAAPAGYRLAGVALGEPDSFAVVETPNGRTALYRIDAEVPGLGRLMRIEAERVVVRTATGEVELWLGPAATPTRTRTPRVRTTPTPGPRPTDRTVPGSGP
jgi:hypothetical protein